VAGVEVGHVRSAFMNPAMDGLHAAARQVDLARPDALVKGSEFGWCAKFSQVELVDRF
jgi:hypothetical protein